jgi:protein arginine N-methyltransferase 1
MEILRQNVQFRLSISPDPLHWLLSFLDYILEGSARLESFSDVERVVYSVRDYAEILSDPVRINAYQQALKRCVTDTAVVLDLGAGTGVFSLLAASLGAKHVYAVESHPAIQLLSQIARDNGLADRITAIEGDSRSIELPERVDLIVSDMRGVLPLCRDALPALCDARERFLKPGGVMIPMIDTLNLMVVECSELYANATKPFGDRPYGFDLSSLSDSLLQSVCRRPVEFDRQITETACWQRIEYSSFSNDHFQNEVTLSVQQSGTAHGFFLWFETELIPGVGYTSGPGAEVRCYDSLFFPFVDPVTVTTDTTISLDLRALLHSGDYTWRWNTEFTNCPEPCRFEQSTFHSDLLPADRLRI